ncbi:MAG TPA: hypothetical protein VFL60_05670 [Gaiellaceae bacterium]|nr:hypothetical protein [Gaiellaceae bacterium]
MHQPLQRWLAGATGFAFVVTWASLGATTAVVAVAVAAAAMNHRELQALLGRGLALGGHRARGRNARRRRSRAAGPADDYQLVPDDPSLVVSVYS